MKSTFKPQLKKPKFNLSATARILVIYFISAIAVFSAIGWLAGQTQYSFWVLAVGVLLAGVAHVWLLIKYFEWDQPNLQKSIFTMVTGVLAISVWFLLLKNVGKSNTYLLSSLVGIAFMLPHFFHMAVTTILEIPDKVFRPYNIQTLEDVDRTIPFIENEKGLLLNFRDRDEAAVNPLPEEAVRLFAPPGVNEMPFKKLFKACILFHNVQINSENPIPIFDNENNQYYNWYFLHKPHFFSGLKYIDPDLTVVENKIKFKKKKTSYGKYIHAAEIFIRRESIAQEPTQVSLEETEISTTTIQTTEPKIKQDENNIPSAASDSGNQF